MRKLSARWRDACSLRTTNATERPLRSSVWRCLSAIRRSFCVVSWPSTKHWFTGTDQSPRNSRNSGLHPANLLWRRRRLFWDSQGVICRRAKRSQGCTMPNYWADSPPNCRKYGPIWRRKMCSSIMTTHRLTLPPSPRPNWSNWATDCYPIHHILQIWPRVTFFVSKLEKVTPWTGNCVE